MSYLQKRRRRWYALMNVPKDVQKRLKKKRFVRSLETESKSEAEHRVLPLIHEWQRLVRHARMNDPWELKAYEYGELRRKAKSPEEKELARQLFEEELDDLRMHGIEVGDPNNVSIYDDDAQRYHGIMMGEHLAISQRLEEWLDEQTTMQKTKDERRYALRRLEAVHPTVQGIDRRTAREFIVDHLRPNSSPATVNKMISAYQTYWRWLSKRGHIPEDKKNPWQDQSLPVRKRRSEGRKPIPEDVGVKIIRDCEVAAQRYPDDALVVKLLAVTGMRLEEVGSLESGDLKDDGEVIWITIREGKTENAARCIPVVDDEVVEALRKRLGDSSEGLWLFPSLTPNKYGDRTQALSKRLARHLRRHTDDLRVVAGHGWRHRARTAQERAGVHPWVSDWFFGHARPGEGLGTYSQGPKGEQLIEAARCLELPSVDRGIERSLAV